MFMHVMQSLNSQDVCTHAAGKKDCKLKWSEGAVDGEVCCVCCHNFSHLVAHLSNFLHDIFLIVSVALSLPCHYARHGGFVFDCDLQVEEQ